MTAEHEGFTLCLPEDMKVLFGAEICPGTSQGADISSSPESEFQPAAVGGVPTSGKIICK